MASSIEKLQSVLDERDWLPWQMPWIKAPFRFGGYLCATNGHFLVGIEGEDADIPEAPDFNGKQVFDLLSAPLTGEAFDLEALKQWSRRDTPVCNLCQGSGKDSCDECKGKGKFECLCECGEVAHLSPCDACQSTGKVDCICHFAIPVEFFGKVVNVLLIHRAVQLFDGTFQVGGSAEKETPVVIGGPGWKALFMPMRKEAEEVYRPVPSAG